MMMCLSRIRFSALIVAAVSCPASANWHVIIDNDSGAPGYVETGATWHDGVSTGYDGGTYRWASAGTVATAEWTADLPAAGDYEVLVWYRHGDNRATSTWYEIHAADHTLTVIVDQQVEGLTWRPLGVFPFDAGPNSVRLVAASSTGGSVVIADAVRFRSMSAACQPDEFDLVAEEAIDLFRTIDGAYDEDRYADSTDAGVLAWNESYILMAYLAMYEATRDPAYFDVVTAHAELVFPHRGDRIGMLDEPRNRIMPAWIATPRHGLGYHAWVVHQGMITFPLARWIYLVNRDAILRAQFGTQADAWRADIIEMVAAFEEELHDGPAPGEKYYDFRYMRPETPDVPMPFNQQNALGRTLVMLWLITGDEQYRSRAEGLARFFRNRLTLIDDRYTWEYWTETTYGEDISHAAINVDFAFQCYRAGIVFDETDMQRFANTLRYLSRVPEGFLGNVNGNPDSSLEYSPAAGRWMHLGFVDPGLRSIYETYLQANWLNSQSFLIGAAYLAETSHPDRLESPLTGVVEPEILLDKSTLAVDGTLFDGMPVQSFSVMTSGIERLDYTITGSEDWLSVVPAVGSVTCGVDEVTVEFGAAAPLPSQYGPHTATISVASPGTAIEPQFITVTMTILPAPPDFDGDGDIDLSDFGYFQACHTGASIAQEEPACRVARLDGDSDVDAADLDLFLQCMRGADLPIEPACWD
jgi:hypothetical protein